MSTAARDVTTHAAEAAGGVHVLKGLLWQEWLAHRGMLLLSIALWLIGTWVLEIFFHPGWILALGILYSILVGSAIGGSDVLLGAEEFSFALPPTRARRYLVRLALAVGPLVLMSALGLLAIGFDLPQALWGLVVESGLTEPFAPCKPQFLYALAFFLPLALISLTFSIAALVDSRTTCASAWLLGAIITGALLAIGFLLEYWAWGEVNGYVSCPLFGNVAVLAMLGGYAVYSRKQGVNHPGPMEGGSRTGIIVAIIIAVVVLFLFLSLIAVRQVAAPVRTVSINQSSSAASAGGTIQR